MINQARVNTGKPSLGLLNPDIYPLIGTSAFRDITMGSNGPNGIYNAGPGYDLCTGIGVPNVTGLIPALAPLPSPSPRQVAKDFNGDGQADLVWENTVTGQRDSRYLRPQGLEILRFCFRVINRLLGKFGRRWIALEHFELLLNRSRKTRDRIYEHVQRRTSECRHS